MAFARGNAIPPGYLGWHHIEYPDYSPSDDFALWLSGYEARVKSTFGFNPDEINRLRDEVVCSIPGKLAVGSALDAYNRLDDADKTDYDRLVSKLTEEFTDPRAKRRFNASQKYNIRQKNQTLKDFTESIKKDMNRYSFIPARIYSANGDLIPNPEREQDGVRRFIAGIRDEKGEEDPEFQRHLGYHLQGPSELTWENALEVASRFESADNDAEQASQIKSGEEEEEDTEGEDAEEEELGAMATKTKSKSKRRDTLSTIANLAYQNQARITSLEHGQERMAAGIEAMNASLEEILAKLGLLFAGNDCPEQQSQNGEQHQ